MLPVMTAAALATLLSTTETTLSLLMLSEVVGVLAVMAAVDAAAPLPTEAVLSLWSIVFDEQGLNSHWYSQRACGTQTRDHPSATGTALEHDIPVV